MELVISASQLSVGSRIAVLGNVDFKQRHNQFGVVASIKNRMVSYVDQRRTSYLDDMGIIAYDDKGHFNPYYKTYLVSEDELESLKAGDDLLNQEQERTASATQAAMIYAEEIARETRNQQHRDALTRNGTVPLSGAAGLILGF